MKLSSSTWSSSSSSSSVLRVMSWLPTIIIGWSTYLIGSTTNAYRCSRCSSGSGSPSFPQWTCTLEPPPTDYCDGWTDLSCCEEDWYESLRPFLSAADCECPDEVRLNADGPETENCDRFGSTCDCQNTDSDWPDVVCPFNGSGIARVCTDIIYVCWNVVPPEVLGLIDDDGNQCTIESAIQEIVYCDDTSQNPLRGGNGPISAPECGDICTSSNPSCPIGHPLTQVLDITSPGSTQFSFDGELSGGFCEYPRTEPFPTSLAFGWTVDQIRRDRSTVDIAGYDYSCPSPTIELSNDPGLCGATVDLPEPDCKLDNVQGEFLDVYAFSAVFGFQEITHAAEVDGYFSGRYQECRFSITEIDDEAPTIVCPSSFTVNLEDSLEWEMQYDLPTVSDNCESQSPLGLPQVSNGPAVGDIVGPSSYGIIYKVFDGAGNEATCAFQIQVNGPQTLPTDPPSTSPSVEPSAPPSRPPTGEPSVSPSSSPSSYPSSSPSVYLSTSPSEGPTTFYGGIYPYDPPCRTVLGWEGTPLTSSGSSGECENDCIRSNAIAFFNLASGRFECGYCTPQLLTLRTMKKLHQFVLMKIGVTRLGGFDGVKVHHKQLVDFVVFVTIIVSLMIRKPMIICRMGTIVVIVKKTKRRKRRNESSLSFSVVDTKIVL